MKTLSKERLLQIVVYFVIINSLILTPFFNKDGMIIPKLITMFCLSFFLLPILLVNRSRLLKDRFVKIGLIIQLMILAQSLIVLIISSAPLEQQIFGRTGRGLGLITYFSMAVVYIAVAFSLELDSFNRVLSGLILSAFISSLYSILQSYGFDFLKWDSRTNGVIGTLGNPNFQSAFAAMVLVPTLFYFWIIKKNRSIAVLAFIFFCFAIYRTQSTQGYLAGFFSIFVAILIFTWYRSKFLFIPLFLTGFASAIMALIGMLNYGPLAQYLYKISVQSRGDFWRSAFTTANSHPFIGVGLDSFGDYSLKYRDSVAANHPFAEYTDNAHNFFLEQAATGGYIFAILNLLLVILTLLLFVKFQINEKKFDPLMTSLFSAWLAFQMTSVISPGSVVTMHWNMVLSAAVLALARISASSSTKFNLSTSPTVKFPRDFSISLALISILIMFPLFNTDRLQLQGMQRGDANLVIEASQRFPESTVRYSLIGRELFNSGLYRQSLEVGRAGVEFNSNSAALWALILVNNYASEAERINAKNMILKLDPLNKNIRSFNP
jgi:O-antigen ligase